MTARLPKRICVLDVETEVTKFGKPEKSKLAIAGTQVYTLTRGRYHAKKFKFYLLSQMRELEGFLQGFDGIVVGHNIFQFDYRVLRPMISLKGVIERTVDTLALLHRKNGKKFGGLSLDNLSRSNFGRGKTLEGKSVSKLWRQGKRRKVIDYNRNDCILTKQLWWLMVSDRRVCADLYKWNDYRPYDTKVFRISSTDRATLVGQKPLFTFRSWLKRIEEFGYILERNERRFSMVDYYDMTMFVPFKRCPKCGSAKLEKRDEFHDGGGMSEGEFAEYMAGTWGTVSCIHCGHVVDYDI